VKKETNNVTELFPVPEGFNVSREDWAKTHPDLRSEINRMVKEFASGMAKYSAGAERDAEMAEWHAMAAEKGTTLPEALGRYVTMQALLERDPLLGLQVIARNTGLDLEAWSRRVLAEPETEFAA
jgi:hypothetical protein